MNILKTETHYRIRKATKYSLIYTVVLLINLGIPNWLVLAEDSLPLSLKQQITITRENGEVMRSAFPSSENRGKLIREYSSFLLLPDGGRIEKHKQAGNKVIKYRSGFAMLSNHYDRTMSYAQFSDSGKQLADIKFNFTGSVNFSNEGNSLVTDLTQGYGESLYLYNQNAKLVKQIKPLKSGFSDAVIGNSAGVFAVVLVSLPESGEASKLLVLDEETGDVLSDTVIDIRSAKSLQVSEKYIAFHESAVIDGKYRSRVMVFLRNGQQVNIIDSYVYRYLINDDNDSVIISAKDSLKSINIQSGTVSWERKYEEIYKKQKLPTPQDVPAGFNVYPGQLLSIEGTDKIALDIAQSSFNPQSPKYEAEIFVLNVRDGKQVKSFYLGKRNSVVNLSVNAKQLNIQSDSVFNAYDVF